METLNCKVCYDKYNKTGKKKILCNSCNIDVCKECIKSYLK